MAKTILESRKRLSDSVLWDLQSSFYEAKNISAWADAIVPNFVTTNAFVATLYAKLILAFITDWYDRHPDTKQPIYVVEIGAGHGKMGFLIVSQLLRMRKFWPNASTDATHRSNTIPFKYIMTDFTQTNIEFWKTRSNLQQFFELGVLDYSLFDAERDCELRLQYSGEVLRQSSVSTPMVAVFNYVFDTLRQDAFKIQNGQLYEALCTIKTEAGQSRPHHDLIAHLQFQWDYQLVESATPNVQYYDDPHLNNILDYYLDSFTDASILIPAGGLQAMKNLQNLSSNRLLVLAGDKAYNDKNELRGIRDPHIAVHGSFSFMVNFHAIGLYIKSQGGISLTTPYADGFKCAAYVLMDDPDPPGDRLNELCSELRLQWIDNLECFGPDSFSTLQRCIKEEMSSPSLKLSMALVRLSNYDCDVFFKFKQVLIDRAPHASERQQLDLKRDARQIHANYYPLQKTKDIPFELGRLMMGLKDYETALVYFLDSQKHCGEHHVSWYNMGICYNYTSQLTLALRCFNKSLRLRPDYHDARNWKARVESLVTQRSSSVVR